MTRSTAGSVLIAVLFTVARVKPVGMRMEGEGIRYDAIMTRLYRSADHLNVSNREFLFLPHKYSNWCRKDRLRMNIDYVVFGDYRVKNGVIQFTVSGVSEYTFHNMHRLEKLSKNLC